MLTEVAALISACTALVAVLIGPIITAKLQRSEKQSDLREKWISDLTDTLSSIVSHAESSAAVLVQSRELNKEFSQKYDFLVQSEGRAKMMLDSNIPSHKELYNSITYLLNIIRDENMKIEEKKPKVRGQCGDITKKAQLVFKEEREKIN